MWWITPIFDEWVSIGISWSRRPRKIHMPIQPSEIFYLLIHNRGLWSNVFIRTNTAHASMLNSIRVTAQQTGYAADNVFWEVCQMNRQVALCLSHSKCAINPVFTGANWEIIVPDAKWYGFSNVLRMTQNTCQALFGMELNCFQDICEDLTFHFTKPRGSYPQEC